MNVIMITNQYTHLLWELCDNLYKILGRKFSLILFTDTLDFPRSVENETNIVLPNYAYVVDKQMMVNEINSIMINADVVYCGLNILKKYFHVLKDKIVFVPLEHLYKEPLNSLNYVKRYFGQLYHYKKYNKQNIFILGSSAYTYKDMMAFKNFENRVFKWGYFPSFDNENIVDLKLLKNKNETMNLLWCGRMINWKHPEKALNVAKKLKSMGIKFKLNIVGSGELMSDCINFVKNENLENEVEFIGYLSIYELRKMMKSMQIHLFTSDYHEGWGAVLNETMNAGCAVVSYFEPGSVFNLLKHKENSLIYKDDDELFDYVLQLIRDKVLREKLGECAFNTIKNEWNPQIAAESFIELANCILNNKEILKTSGICSRAEIVEKVWFK